MAKDRLAARHEIRRLTRFKSKSLSEQKLRQRLARLEKRLTASVRRKSLRQQNLPPLRYIDELPITAKKDDIIRAISEHAVIIVSGETGSGKTTQIPKFCLAAGRGVDGLIGHTQPRRIAATTVAHRIAEELGQNLGYAVGYKIRFQDRTPQNAYIKLMTDGILLAETQTDRLLSAYDTIIVDEAHERSLNIDFILGILQTLLIQRDDLKLIITSATIDTQKFSKAFNNAPVIEVSGRMYQVDTRYQSEEGLQKENGDVTHVELAVQAVNQIQNETPWGDILVFMPTEQDIRDTCELIETETPAGSCILPLFARLTGAEQARVFQRMSRRKIIVATNIAETSITIPGIKYVVDSGLARISRYSPRSRTTSLPVVPISQSSADQRKGRCGRLENGVCLRLYSEADYNNLDIFTPPEIVRANLAEVILRMISLKLGDISQFPFIDRPELKNIKDGFQLLFELGAIKHRRYGRQKAPYASPRSQTAGADPYANVALTEIGRLMAKIPLDPRLSRMLIEAKSNGCVNEIAVIASALSIQDPRERPAEKTREADRMRATLSDPHSDFITLLNIWNRYHFTGMKVKANNQMKRFCRDHYLSFRRMREWRDIYHQICALLVEHGLVRNTGKLVFQETNYEIPPESSKYSAIHKSILSGFLSNIAEKKEKNIFRAAKGRDVMIFPGSGLFDRAANWVVAAEMVETSRVFARTVADIDPAWLEDLGRDLCRHTYLNPHWERSRGEVGASEQVSLFGLIIVPGRKVSFGRVDPDQASDIFIRSALIEGDVKKPFAFMKYNQGLIDSIMAIEDRIRRRDVLISEADMFAFYKDRIGGIYNLRSLSAYLKTKGNDNFLLMKKDDLCLYQPDAAELSLFPEQIELGGHAFDCRYRFVPGKDDDGVTVNVPSTLTSQVSSEAMDWLVPGLFKEKIGALIKGLPKTYRRKLVPLGDTVEVISREMQHTQDSLIAALGNFIYRRFGLDIPASAWPVDALPDYLKMRISVTAPDGREICAGRDPAILQQHFDEKAGLTGFESARNQWEKTGITRWDFGDLPDYVSNSATEKAGWIAYPALEKSGSDDKCVNLRLFRQRDEAMVSHKQGVATLYRIYFSKNLKFLKRRLALPNPIVPMADYFGGVKRFEKRMFEWVIRGLFEKNIRSENEFYDYAERIGPNILDSGQEIIEKAIPILTAYHETRSLLSKLRQTGSPGAAVTQFINHLKKELVRLVPQAFIELYDLERLIHLVRYIKAVEIRAQRAMIDFEKDSAKEREIRPFRNSLNQLLDTLSPHASAEKRNAIEEYFWMVEEYKVSVFAQELKTAFPISEKRLQDKLKQIRRMV
ncbi:MAG: ATP-dependent RNA helicase HrpA [Desulfobacterales bacterium]|nr:MAG: ATP-dependent RNA helicase HrpA [Desulfobacterales bacterium]